MNPALITYHDKTQALIANVSKETHEHFANTYGLDYIGESDEEVNKECYFKKIHLTLRELNAGRPYVIWSDADVVFNKTLEPDFIDKAIGDRPMAMSTEPMGLVDCFYIAKNDEMVKKLFQMWLDLGYVRNFTHEQETFLLLYRHFPKISQLVSPISMDKIGITYLSNPASIGKHFYARSKGIAMATENMMKYKREAYHEIVQAP